MDTGYFVSGNNAYGPMLEDAARCADVEAGNAPSWFASSFDQNGGVTSSGWKPSHRSKDATHCNSAHEFGSDKGDRRSSAPVRIENRAE